MSERKRVAYHEAGHTVAAYAFGMPFRYVTIKPTEGTLGHARFYALPKWFRPDIFWNDTHVGMLTDHIVVCLAGPEAEERVTGVYDAVVAAKDLESAVYLAMYLGGGPKDTQEKYDSLQATAGEVVREHWGAVEALAQALLEQEMLRAGAARDVMVAALCDELNQAAQERKAARKRLMRRGAAEARELFGYSGRLPREHPP